MCFIFETLVTGCKELLLKPMSVEAGETALVVKCLLCKPETCVWGSGLQEKPGTEVCACDLSAGEAETGRSFVLASLAESVSFRLCERPCFKKQCGE